MVKMKSVAGHRRRKKLDIRRVCNLCVFHIVDHAEDDTSLVFFHMPTSPCRICGYEMNTIVVKFWGPDDGWVIGALCPHCDEAYGDCKPHQRFHFTRTLSFGTRNLD